MYLEYGSLLGKKKRFKLEGITGCVISSDKNDNIYVASLVEKAAVSVFQEADKWVMMSLNCHLIVNGKECQSVDLHDGLKVTVAQQEFKVVEDVSEVEGVGASDPLEMHSVKKLSKTNRLKISNGGYSTLIAIMVFMSVLLLLLLSHSEKDSTLPEVDVPENVQSLDDGKANDGKNSDIQKTADLNSQGKANEVEDTAYAYYIDALSYYDLGFLKQAIQEVQSGLLKYPGNPLLLSKLNEWESKLNILISQSYKDACLHALYLRNLEALQMFAIVVEMAIDTKDVRYRESVRMYKELENAAVDQRLECGVL